MVRRDVSEFRVGFPVWGSEACCAFPAGESPVPVGAGAPGSRSRGEGEIPRPQAGCRKPTSGGEQARGPQHEVKPAASTEEQFGGRAAHVTAKATDIVLVPEWTVDTPGVWRRARGEGSAGNRRGPTRWPTSGRSGRYKPTVKCDQAGRESEGSIVLLTPGEKPGRGKGPCFGHAVRVEVSVRAWS